jgi:PAS domain S-box-containing protein
MIYRFTDLIDIDRLQELMSRLYTAAGIPVGIIGTDGTIYVATGWQEICTKFHRQHQITNERCRESDAYISAHLDEGPYIQYRCKNGLWDIALPIRLRGEHMATLFVGQFHFEDDPPDRDFFISQAEECGFEKEEYLQALDKLPLFSHEKMQAIIDYYLLFVTQLMDEGLTRLERLAAQDALSKSEGLYRSIIELAADMILLGDNLGNIIGANKSATLLTGYLNEELLGMNIACLFSTEELQRVPLRYDLLKEGKTVRNERFLVCKDGANVPIEMNTRMMPDGTYQAFLRDMTEHRIMQAELIRSQKLESLGVLAGGIAHDFNNILTGILGNVSFAKMVIDKAHEAYLPLERAEKASFRAADLANQLLVFAKGGQPVKKPVSLQNIMTEAVSLALSGTNVKCYFDFPRPLHTVEADEGQINQAFHNIIINAVQAMPGGGNLIVHGENVNLDDDSKTSIPAGNYVKLTIRDEGCGISESDQKKIFDPYFSTKSRGSGLGLASTHTIIDKHGGHVSADSTVGVGTIFTIHLPSTGVTASDHGQLDDSLAISRKGGSILVMDDDEMVRDLATLILSRSGYIVKTCVNGDEAISLYRSANEAGTPYTAVIMDLTIPGGMGGVEAAKHLLALDPEARLIVSSGYSDDPVMAHYKEYGFCAAMEKPYNVSAISQILVEVDLESLV